MDKPLIDIQRNIVAEREAKAIFSFSTIRSMGSMENDIH